MTKRMLIDATHAEETRVVVLDGNRLEDFDVETSTKKQLKGNIYLAKVVRVEPSLQAAFVEYGGGRHGFLAFGEIHPDYYQIPVADRERLLAMQAEEARAEEEDEDDVPPPPRAAAALDIPAGPVIEVGEFGAVEFGAVAHGELAPPAELPAPTDAEIAEVAAWSEAPGESAPAEAEATSADDTELGEDEAQPDLPPPEVIGGENDTFEGNGAEEARKRRSARFLRNYRIQEVIRRRQILLIQVVKEERGTKGAALTTYISLAGRYCVLMPNSPRGGGISRKITSAADRRRLKEITAEMEIPAGMGLIVRTAGANRPKPEIRRDCEYLMRLWDDIREHTLKSVAPALIYEEASLIKRAIRDVYSRDVDEVVVDGEEGWKAAHDFMRMLMPSHARKVLPWRAGANGGMPLFSRYAVDAQLDAMMSPTVQLKSGGYLVINQAEALVAIDVNSGRSTRERGIEETALRTNLEAADEVARQLRLRDLAGLIVIDFIDMEARKHNAMVERRLKDALKTDRARIQVGSISHFGLLEMSRQRLRPSLTETNFVACPHCGGLGHVRSVESSAIHVLRAVEEEAAKGRASQITLHAASAVVLYLLNHKRERLIEIEARTGMRTHFATDDTLVPPALRIDRDKPAIPASERPAPMIPAAPAPMPAEAIDDDDDADVVLVEDADLPDAPRETAADGDEAARGEDGERRRRRRRRRRGRREDGTPQTDQEMTDQEMADQEMADQDRLDPAAEETSEGFTPPSEPDDAAAPAETDAATAAPTGEELDENGNPKPRRRGRRGGRRRRRDDAAPGAAGETDEGLPEAPEAIPAYAAPVVAVPVYTGPTPADPFGGNSFDIYDIMDQVEQQEAAPRPAPPPAAPMPPTPPPVAAAVAAPVMAPVSAEPTREPVPEPQVAAQPEPEPVAGPLIQPIVIGQDKLPDAPPKRGWWRR